MIYAVISVILGYLLGSINSAVIISKVFYRQDIRKMGSGNAGTTNVLRSLGKKAALFTFLGDFAKGILAVILGLLFYGRLGMVLAGGAAILGHNWPVYFGFKGGKGVLTSFAVMLIVSWKAALVSLLIFIIVVALTRYVSLGSILAAISIAAFVYIFNGFNFDEVFCLSFGISLLVIFRHSANIKRLIKGTESKLGSKKANK